MLSGFQEQCFDLQGWTEASTFPEQENLYSGARWFMVQRPWSVRYEWEMRKGCFREVREVPSFVTVQPSFPLVYWLRRSETALLRSVGLCQASSCSSLWSLSVSVCVSMSLALLLSLQISEQMQSQLPFLYQGNKIWNLSPYLITATGRIVKRAILGNTCFQFRHGFERFLSSGRKVHNWSVLLGDLCQSVLALLCSQWPRMSKNSLCLAHWIAFL